MMSSPRSVKLSSVNRSALSKIFPWRRIFSFATIGVFCTVLSLTLNYIFLKWMGTKLIPTYSVVYAVTILISFMLNSRFTFESHVSVSNAVTYFGIYLSAMGLGVLLLLFYRSVFTFENWIYPFMAVPFTMLWNFSWSSRLLKKKVL